MKSKGTLAFCVLLGISITGFGFFSKKASEQQAALDRLRQDKQKLETLLSENQRLKSITIDPLEMERLRRETPILMQLRNEFGKLSRVEADSNTLPASVETSMQALLHQRDEILAEEQKIRELSNRAACIKNLEVIVSAKARWASDNSAEKGQPVSMENLLLYLPERATPVCPAQGHYSVNRIGAPPGCSIDGHAVP